MLRCAVDKIQMQNSTRSLLHLDGQVTMLSLGQYMKTQMQSLSLFIQVGL